MMRQIGWAVLLLGSVALAACGGQAAASKPAGGTGAAGGSGAAQSVTVKGVDPFKFDPETLTVRANTPVRITLDNSAANLDHNFVVDNLGGRKFEVDAKARATASGEFTAPAGTYEFYCSVPGHREAGMKGTLRVS
jgi:uncharacterized cupredoxin-like copper-binding protein